MLDRTRIFLAACCVALTGCAQSPGAVKPAGQPDWLNAAPAAYPEQQYLYATGSASEPEVAKDRAAANLAKIFELQIRETSTTTEDVQTHREHGTESVRATARLASKVNVHTSKMLNGVRIVEQWRHPDDLTHYALAVLDRDQARNNVLGEINRLDREIAFTMMNAQKRAPGLQKVSELQNAITMQAERNALQKTLKVLDLEGRGKPSSWNLSELKAQQKETLQALNMRPIVLADSVGELDRVLQAAMARAGFNPSSADGGYTLSASMLTQDTMRKQGWYWLRGTLKLELIAPEGTVLGNKSWPLKVSAQQETQLNHRMLAEIDRKLERELKSAVLDFATGGE